jgi:hypothetical protein
MRSQASRVVRRPRPQTAETGESLWRLPFQIASHQAGAFCNIRSRASRSSASNGSDLIVLTPLRHRPRRRCPITRNERHRDPRGANAREVPGHRWFVPYGAADGWLPSARRCRVRDLRPRYGGRAGLLLEQRGRPRESLPFSYDGRRFHSGGARRRTAAGTPRKQQVGIAPRHRNAVPDGTTCSRPCMPGGARHPASAGSAPTAPGASPASTRDAIVVPGPVKPRSWADGSLFSAAVARRPEPCARGTSMRGDVGAIIDRPGLRRAPVSLNVAADKLSFMPPTPWAPAARPSGHSERRAHDLWRYCCPRRPIEFGEAPGGSG